MDEDGDDDDDEDDDRHQSHAPTSTNPSSSRSGKHCNLHELLLYEESQMKMETVYTYTRTCIEY